MGISTSESNDGARPQRLKRRPRWFGVVSAIWLLACLGYLGAITWAPEILYVTDWLAWALPGQLVSFLLVLALLWLTVPIWAIVVAARRAQRRAWRGAARAVCVPIIAALAVPYGRDLGEIARFRLERAGYLAAIEAARAGHPLPQTRVDIGPPTFAYFNWGGMSWASSGVAFDETDEAGKPDAARSEAWRTRHSDSELACEAAVRPLGSHFYMVRTNC